MGSTTTQTSIANRALQLLGYKAISDISENSAGANAIRRAYTPVLESELRKNYWNFAIRRASLAAAAVGPAFGKNYYYPLPEDFLCIVPPDEYYGADFGMPMGATSVSGPNSVDWLIEGNQIASNQPGPLNIRYITKKLTESLFDPCFAEAMAAALAINVCEELTQSNSKIQTAGTFYESQIETAKQRNAFESRPVRPPTDSYILARY